MPPEQRNDDAAARRRAVGRRIRELRSAAGMSQEDFAEQVDVERHTVSRWENGRTHPRPRELTRICSRFGMAPRDLLQVASGADVNRRDFFSTAGRASIGVLAAIDPAWQLVDPERLDHSIRRQVVDETIVEHLEAETQNHSRLYFRLSAPNMLDSTQGFLRQVMQLREGTVPDQLRPRLAAVVAEEAGRAAWLAYDLGRSGASEQFYAVAEEAAGAADPQIGAYVAGYKSSIRVSHGQISEGLELAVAARNQAEQGEPSIRAWLAAMEAQAAAAAQDRRRCEAALRDAENLLDVAWGIPGKRLFWLDPWRLSATAGACYERLGDPVLAAREFVPALDYMAKRSPRGRSEMQLDLAGVALLQRDVERACDLAVRSLEGALEAGSEAQLDRVRQFRIRLHPWSNLPAVEELTHRLSLA